MTKRTIQVITTEDGSHSLYCPELSEIYHSTRGAIEESQYVYIRQGFERALRPKRAVRILEIGFGTGLNVLLTLQHAQHIQQGVFFHTLEPFPLEREVWEQLNYAQVLNLQGEWKQMHECNWQDDFAIAPHFILKKEAQRLEDVELKSEYYHLVYFDGFAPAKQAEIWDIKNLKKLFVAMCKGAILVTYAAQRTLRISLEEVGFQVECLKGPPGKKEMTLARKL
jgi:tRNA U34 5-methylaminomethyl-2-thiouridine-forming methyltransferase MnmC